MRRHEDNFNKYMPFYENISKHKTSAEIISEARAGIHRDMSDNINMLSGGSGAPRTLGTQRPFTPRERQRTLFGKASRTSRPPSAVNLKYLKHQCNDNSKTLSIPSKKGHLSPVIPINTNYEDHIFNNYILDNIDEKLELSSRNKTNNDEYLKKKSLHPDYDQTLDNQMNAGSKLKLPSLNGLAKPLHHRKNGGNQRSNFLLQSLPDTQDDASTYKINGFSPLITSKSLDSNIQKSIKSNENADHFPNIHNTISMEVFNKRRIFGNNTSKSDEGINESRNIEIITNEANKIPDETSTVEFAVQIQSSESSDQLTNAAHKIEKPNLSPINSMQNILNHLSSHEQKTDDDVTEMLFILYDTLDKENQWQNIRNEEKTSILKVLYSFIESTNEKLLVAIARIILALRVTGSNLSGVCKLIFKIARNDKNDHLFMNDNILELFMVGLGRAEPLHDAECLVYGYGALKFLGMNSTLLERMRPLGALPLMTLHLKMFNEAVSDNIHGVGEQGCHGLYQLTGALRNMAGGDMLWSSGISSENFSNTSSPCNHLLDFITGGTLTEICRSINYFTDDLDVEINASRTLSVLSADYECCVHLCEQKGIITAIIKLLTLYSERTPLVVRLTYILGNMVACNNETRLELYDESGSIGVLMKILDAYIKHCWPRETVESAENIIIGSDLDGSNGSDEDVMIKTIRVIANMCMNSTVGSYLAESNGSGDKILTWILKCLRQYSHCESEELTVSTLAALNNLSYYHSGDNCKMTAFSGFQIHFCEALCRLLPLKSGPCVTEAIRVLGNMSRSKVTRDYIVDKGALVDITKLTENDDEETALAAAGVLVNMAADESARQIWIQVGGLKMASDALQKATSRHRWQLGQLICQALWNATPLPNTEISQIAPLLLDLLDEQQVFGNLDSPTGINIINEKAPLEENYLLSRLTWEEFAAMAVNLLEKIDPTLDSPHDDYDVDNLFISNNHNGTDLTPI